MLLTRKWLGLCFLLCSMATLAQDKPMVTVGGALRFNYNYSTWKDGQKKRGGDLGYDVFKLNTKAEYKGLKLNAEYRFYSSSSGGGMLKQGWIGYDFNEKNQIHLGLTQVPFGVSKYNSNSWFFSLGFYVGLEDDHDMGVKYSHEGKNWDYDIAFFKNAEELRFGNNSDLDNSRYAYDVSSINIEGNTAYRNKEINQLNGRLVYKYGNYNVKARFGMSALYGGLYNLDTEEVGDRYALALHHNLTIGKFNIKAQWAKYQYNVKNPSEELDDVIAMTAYGTPYLVASEASIYTIALVYNISLKGKFIEGISIYNDFGLMEKKMASFKDSYMNVLGAMITMGNIYTYIDFAAGKSHPWLGGDWNSSLENAKPVAEWEMRFNINIGYYF